MPRPVSRRSSSTVIVGRLQAFVALLLVNLLVALAGGIPPGEIADVVEEGIGGVLGFIAVVVGLGTIIGQLVQTSGGGAEVARRMIDRFGEDRAPRALGITGFIIAIPVFFDVGLIIFFGRSRASLALILGGVVYGRFIGKRIDLPVPEYMIEETAQSEEEAEAQAGQDPPGIGIVLLVIGLPLGLILLNTLSEAADRVFPHGYRFEEGYLHPGDAPGLGADIDGDLAAEFPYRRAYLPVNRPTDGTVHDW